MVGRIAKKWHFCYTIHKTPHLSIFLSGGGNDDGVLLLVVLLLFVCKSVRQFSQFSQTNKQKQVSLFVMIHILFLVHERNTHALCINFHASQKKVDRENIINPLVHSSHFPQLHIFSSRKAKQQQAGNTPKFFVLRHQKKSPYSTASGAKPAGPGIHKHTRHTTPLIT